LAIRTKWRREVGANLELTIDHEGNVGGWDVGTSGHDAVAARRFGRQTTWRPGSEVPAQPLASPLQPVETGAFLDERRTGDAAVGRRLHHAPHPRLGGAGLVQRVGAAARRPGRPGRRQTVLRAGHVARPARVRSRQHAAPAGSIKYCFTPAEPQDVATIIDKPIPP